ncbi:retinol dehydrogenase 12 [Bombyx mori]|uniref:Uncharacterized protein n=1 Tax=Bombyx mori TaxID=7091 RepID=A0A8R2M5N6_BOMMO|nr:retinol dehydrogenase 12-like [Bombyx mori]
MFVLALLCVVFNFVLYSFAYLLLFLILAIIGYRLFIEPIKGVCKSKAKLNGKIALVTGGNSGIGLETARDLAARGATVIIASRNEDKALEAIEDIVNTTGNDNIKYMNLDLAKFKNIRKFAENFNKTYKRLDILVNNAGCAGLKRKLSEDGIDLVMQINYFGPYLLTNLLLDKLIKSKPSRIVNVSSYAHNFGELNIDNVHCPVTDSYLKRYANSKLCQVLWTRALAKRLPVGITANALHPGVVNTDIFKRLKIWQQKIVSAIISVVFKDAIEGAQTTLHLCVAEELEGVTGKYFVDCKQANMAAIANDDKIAEELWNKSVLLTECVVE